MLGDTLNRPCGGRYGSVLEAVGNTPLVELPRLSPTPGVRIFAKLEGRNPTGSVKDRVAKAMIEGAEKEGAIAPGQTILEPTSGNTGIAMALVARRRGYPLTVVMADNVSPERRTLVRAFGAAIIDSPGSLGSNGAIAKARQLAARDPKYALADQYERAGDIPGEVDDPQSGQRRHGTCPLTPALLDRVRTPGTVGR